MKLSPEAIAECQQRHKAGETYSSLAREFGVKPAVVHHAVNRPPADPRVLRARVASFESWGNTSDRTTRGQDQYRKGLGARFEREARERHPDASDAEIQAAAESIKRAYFARLAASKKSPRRR